MANYFGKAENTARAIVKAFENGNVPKALSQVFISGVADNHCSNYSFLNRFIVAIHGYTDAMGFKQWKNEGRNVKKGEKAFYILAPVLKENGETDKNGNKIKICIGFRGVPVFGYEQTKGKERASNPKVTEFIENLPFKEVAEKWGLNVSAYNGQNSNALGYYVHGQSIGLGTENLSTWAHELAHAADDKIGELDKSTRALSEVCAEFAGAVLLTMAGMEKEADVGGAYEYIKNWAGAENKKTEDACRTVITRVCSIIEKIMTTADEMKKGESQAV